MATADTARRKQSSPQRILTRLYASTMRGESQLKMLAQSRELATAVARRPRELARLVVFLNREDGHAVASLVAGVLPEREIRRLAFSLLARERRQQLTCTRNGFSWTVDTADEIGEQIYVEGRYEGEEVEAVLAWLGAGDRSTVVEVGANIGTTTLPLAKAGYRVVAIEPVPSTFAMLLRNVETNGFASRVRCVNRAVSATTAQVEMWVTNGSDLSELAVGGHGPGFSQNGPAFDGAKRRISVEGDRLDRLLSLENVSSEDIALVWSDAQGSEPYVVETGTDLWAAGVPLYVEVAPYLLELQGGLDMFIEQVERNFGQFVTRNALVAGGGVQDIKDFRTFATGLIGIDYSDALLIPSR
jgi:FkbM family methyltransferase